MKLFLYLFFISLVQAETCLDDESLIKPPIGSDAVTVRELIVGSLKDLENSQEGLESYYPSEEYVNSFLDKKRSPEKFDRKKLQRHIEEELDIGFHGKDLLKGASKEIQRAYKLRKKIVEKSKRKIESDGKEHLNLKKRNLDLQYGRKVSWFAPTPRAKEAHTKRTLKKVARLKEGKFSYHSKSLSAFTGLLAKSIEKDNVSLSDQKTSFHAMVKNICREMKRRKLFGNNIKSSKKIIDEVIDEELIKHHATFANTSLVSGIIGDFVTSASSIVGLEVIRSYLFPFLPPGVSATLAVGYFAFTAIFGEKNIESEDVGEMILIGMKLAKDLKEVALYKMQLPAAVGVVGEKFGDLLSGVGSVLGWGVSKLPYGEQTVSKLTGIYNNISEGINSYGEDITPSTLSTTMGL